MRVTTRSQPIVITVDPYASLTLSSPPLSSRTPLCPRPHSRHLPQQPPPPQQQQHHTTLLLLLLLHHHLSTLSFLLPKLTPIQPHNRKLPPPKFPHILSNSSPFSTHLSQHTYLSIEVIVIIEQVIDAKVC